MEPSQKKTMSYSDATKRFVFLGESLNGCYAKCPPEMLCGSVARSSYSGMYDELSSYFQYVVEGGTVCDKKPCFEKDEEASIRQVFAGPMLNVDLPDGHMKTTKYVEDMEYVSEPYVVGTKGIIDVSLDVYLNMWRKLGARIGKRVGLNIVWEDGTVEEIRTGK